MDTAMGAVRLMHTLCRFVVLGIPAASPHDHVWSVPPEKHVALGLGGRDEAGGEAPGLGKLGTTRNLITKHYGLPRIAYLIPFRPRRDSKPVLREVGGQEKWKDGGLSAMNFILLSVTLPRPLEVGILYQSPGKGRTA